MRGDNRPIPLKLAVAAALCAGLALGGVAQASYAAIANSNSVVWGQNALTYVKSSYVQNNTSPGTAGTRVGRNDGGASSAGYLGGNAVMRSSGGAICASAGTTYNGGSVVTHISVATKVFCGSAAVRQEGGQVFVYNVSTGSYSTNTPIASPYLTLP